MAKLVLGGWIAILALAGGAAAVAAPGVQDLCAPKVVSTDVVATAAERKAAGALVSPPSLIDPVNGFAWPDTPVGVTKSRDGQSWLFFASDGGCHANCASVTDRYGSITRTVGTLDHPSGVAAPVETVLTGAGLGSPVDYVGGGPVFRVPNGLEGAGALLMVYHIERSTYAPGHRYPDPLKYQTSFYASLGLAKSVDDGLTWTDLGEIIRANRPYEPNAPGYEIGDGDLVVDATGSYVYVYFPDRLVGGKNTFLSVARAPMRAVLDEAFGGGPRVGFTKYDRGAWNQPGIGGRSSTLLPTPYPTYAGAPQIAFNSYLGRYIAILDDTQNITYAESPDGLIWSDPVLIEAVDPTNASANYAVAVGLDGHPASLGRSYYVYFTYSLTGADPKLGPPGWAGAQLRRLTVDCPMAKP